MQFSKLSLSLLTFVGVDALVLPMCRAPATNLVVRAEGDGPGVSPVNLVHRRKRRNRTRLTDYYLYVGILLQRRQLGQQFGDLLLDASQG
jgi:hypothetical protein